MSGAFDLVPVDLNIKLDRAAHDVDGQVRREYQVNLRSQRERISEPLSGVGAMTQRSVGAHKVTVKPGETGRVAFKKGMSRRRSRVIDHAKIAPGLSQQVA